MVRILLVISVLLVHPIYTFSQKNKPPKPPNGYWCQTTLKMAYALGTLKLIDTEPHVPETITKHNNIVYKIAGNDTLRIDIYQHQNINKPAPLLIFIHGGSWKGGNKDDYRRYLVDFAQQGYITATVSYRFSQQAKFPAAVNDVKCAVKWLKQNADEYMIDTEKIAVIGGSAGAHLAMMVGYSPDVPEFENECAGTGVDSRVQAVVDIYGPADLTAKIAIESDVVYKFLGKSYSEAPDLYIKASPINYLSKDDPPTLIFHGTIDKTVPVNQSDKLKAALDKEGIEAEYHRLKGWPHTMDLGLKVNNYCQYYMKEFFEKYLK
ncbi:MAG: alpha/beta hydrolase [Bacteroidota bacterium]